MLAVKVGFPVHPARVPMETLLCRILWKLLPGRGHRTLPTPALQFGFQGGFLWRELREQGRGRAGGWSPGRAQWASEVRFRRLGSEKGGGHDPRAEVVGMPGAGVQGQARQESILRPPAMGPWGWGRADRGCWGFSYQF